MLFRSNDIAATVTEVIALIKAAVPKIIKPTNRRRGALHGTVALGGEGLDEFHLLS